MAKKKPPLACAGCEARQQTIEILQEELRARRAAPASPPVVEPEPPSVNDKGEPVVKIRDEDTGLIEEMTIKEYREYQRGLAAALAGKPVIIGSEDMQ